MDESNVLTKKLGPFPGYIWLIGMVGIALILYMKKRASAVTVPAGTDSAVFPSAVGNAPGTNQSLPTTASGPMGTQQAENGGWAKMVSDALIATGGNPTDIENALSNFLNGNPLDSTQQSVINTALRQYGAPPQGVLPVNTQQEASAYTGHSYTVQSGDTLDSIMKKFYNETPGSTQNSVALARITAANGLQWNAATKQYDVKQGQALKLYSDAGVGVGDSTFHWPVGVS